MLGDVFGVGGAVGHFGHSTNDCALMSFHEETEGLVVAFCDAGHPSYVFIIGILSIPHESSGELTRGLAASRENFPGFILIGPKKGNTHD